MKSIKIVLIGFFVLLNALPAIAKTPTGQLISYEEFTLKNGLRVIIHEDHRTPIVNVGVWYHVGSKDEPIGKTGFAHLFEHIMFRGSENFTGSYTEALEEMGASSLNGTTSTDRTNYFQTVPTPALESVLWLESDRMGHLLGAVTQDVLDAERGVVQNEKRQREGAPMGQMIKRLMAGLYPAGHPYHHPTVGSMDDLNAASLDDVHAWFKQYYGAANAVVVLAGDIDTDIARPLMEKYFGDIPAGPPLHRMQTQIPDRINNSFEVMYDKVAQPTLIRAWAAPSQSAKEMTLLDLNNRILGSSFGDTGKNSRFYKVLVDERKLANSVMIISQSLELSGMYLVMVQVKTGVAIKDVERALDDVMREYLDNGPTKKEIKRVKAISEAGIIRGLESVSTRGMVLAEGALYDDNPGNLDDSIKWTREATHKQVHKVAKKWLSRGFHQLVILPFGEHETIVSRADRSKRPIVKNDLELNLPTIQKATLSNGIKVVLAEQHAIPVVDLMVKFTGTGTNTDPKEKSGISGFSMSSMGEGPANLSAVKFADLKEELGLSISLSGGTESVFGVASILKHNLKPSISVFADLIRDPAFRLDEFELNRDVTLDGLEHGKNDARTIASNVLHAVVYGKEHPYTHNWDSEEIIKSFTVEDMKTFHAKHILPQNMVVLVSGDITMAELTTVLEKELGNWKRTDEPVKAKILPRVAVTNTPRIIMVDLPNSPQSTIMAGRLIPPGTEQEGEWAFKTANDVFGGGSINGRLGKNLRVDKAWSYGATSWSSESVGQSLLAINAPVQADKTAESVTEILQELRDISGRKPVTQAELDLYIKGTTLSLPGNYERGISLLIDLWKSQSLGRPYDDAENIPERLKKVTLSDVNKAARMYFNPDHMTWVIVGDLSEFEQKVRDLNVGEVEIWNTDGKRIR